MAASWLAGLGSSILLFFLVFGMSATVEMKQLLKQMTNITALCIGVSLQFVVLPFVGFVVVKMLHLSPALGITLLVITSSPGGSYSNWWCSMFNAELALSVSMTAMSTVMSTVMLPINLILYSRWTYSSAVVQSLDWTALFISLVVVIGGISCGLGASAYMSRQGIAARQRLHRRANLLGNIAGVSLVTLSVSVTSSDHEAAVWDQDAAFYIGVALPAILGLLIAVSLATRFELDKPERVAVAVEACFQNTGIATSVAINMFSADEEQIATALGVPLYYGLVEATMLGIFCIVCWKKGWTKAPVNENLFVVLYTSYEVEEMRDSEHDMAIEVVLGAPTRMRGGVDLASAKKNTSLIFSESKKGTYVIDEATLEDQQNNNFNNVNGSNSSGSTGGSSNGSNNDVTEGTADEYDEVVLSEAGHETKSESIVKKEGETVGAAPISSSSASSFFSEGGRFSRAIATMRARATVYRTPAVSVLPATISGANTNNNQQAEERFPSGQTTAQDVFTTGTASSVVEINMAAAQSGASTSPTSAYQELTNSGCPTDANESPGRAPSASSPEASCPPTPPPIC